MTTTAPKPEQHGGIASALAAFQAEAPAVGKGKTARVPTKSGGEYSYKYADLASISEVALPLLAKHGLSFTCRPKGTEAGFVLQGQLRHTSGERVTGELPIFGRTAQEIGSSLTYNRRYLLGCLTGIVTDEDDDGKASNGSQPTRQQRNRPQQAPPQGQPDDAVAQQAQMLADTASQVRDLTALKGVHDEAVARHLIGVAVTVAGVTGPLGQYLLQRKADFENEPERQAS